MTTQHRVLRGLYPQSQSQPIPQRFGNPQQPQFNAGQAYSPRHRAPPSSSPLHQHKQFYPPVQHEMFKGPGVGTPPTMMGMPQPQQQQQQQYSYMNGGQRPRAPHQTIPVRSSIYYGHGPPMVRGYPNVPPPPQQYFSPSPGARASSTSEKYKLERQQLQLRYKRELEELDMEFQKEKIELSLPLYETAAERRALENIVMSQDVAPDPNQVNCKTLTTQPLSENVSSELSPNLSAPLPSQGDKESFPSSIKQETKLVRIVNPSTNRSINDDIKRSQKRDTTSKPPTEHPNIPSTSGTNNGDGVAKFADKVDAAAIAGEAKRVERDVRVILNKITPTNFKELMQQIPSLKIDTEKKLRKTIDLIFERAINEPTYSKIYANMCRQMTQIRVTPEALPENPNLTGQVEFRKLLLTKCQREFERHISDREDIQELKKKMEANMDKELAPQLREANETAELKDRRRKLGNIRFIGELFKLRMLTEPIIHFCLMKLLKAKDDDHLESLCHLLTTIGKDLDTRKAKLRMNRHFDQIKKIIAEKRTSSRVHFMLKDVNDLRLNNWTPRVLRLQVSPKTISQIRQDFRRQEMCQMHSGSIAKLSAKQKLTEKIEVIVDDLIEYSAECQARKVLALNIASTQDIKSVIDVIFEKAADSPLLYKKLAQFCHQLATVRMTKGTKVEKHVSFQHILSQKCGLEIERNRKTHNEVTGEISTSKERMCMMGHVMLIGQLFNIGMVTSSEIHCCIQVLLAAKDDIHLECLSRLFTIIRKNLDLSKEKGSRGQNRMNNRGSHEDGWNKVQTQKPTRFDSSKMKILKANIEESKVTLGPSRGFGGWKSDSAGFNITKTGSSGYSPSSSTERTPESGPRSNTPTSMMNRFSALQGSGPDHEYQRRQGGRSGSREGSRSGSRGSMGPPSSNSGGLTPRKDERTSLLEATRKIMSADRSQESRQRSSRESTPSVPKPRPAHKYNMDLDEEKMQQKSRSILEEFLSIVDFKEATECIEELNAPPTLMYALVYVGHEFTLEKKGVARNNIGRLMAHLLKRGRLSVEQYVKGLAELLEMATDSEIYIPKVWEYFAEQMAPVFIADNDSEISLNVLGTLAAPLLEEDKSGVFVIEIIKQVLEHESLESFVARWRKSNLLWSKITGKNEEGVRNFLGSHKLEALDDNDGQSPQTEDTTSSVGHSKSNDRYRLEKDVTELLNKGLSNYEIFDWVEKTLSPDDAHGPDFVRALTISVCKRSLNRDKNDQDKMTLDEEKISERSILLNKYIENRPERELQVLYALQNLMVELDQPRDVLRKFFDIFYNEDVVQEQTFYNWETSDDPNEQEGRGVAVASVNMFFTWLHTAEPESD